MRRPIPYPQECALFSFSFWATSETHVTWYAFTVPRCLSFVWLNFNIIDIFLNPTDTYQVLN